MTGSVVPAVPAGRTMRTLTLPVGPPRTSSHSSSISGLKIGVSRGRRWPHLTRVSIPLGCENAEGAALASYTFDSPWTRN